MKVFKMKQSKNELARTFDAHFTADRRDKESLAALTYGSLDSRATVKIGENRRVLVKYVVS